MTEGMLRMAMKKEFIMIDETNGNEVDAFFSTHSISEIFRYRRSNLQNTTWKRDALSLEAISDLVGLTTEVLRKKIYQQRPMTRDCLIAICAAHGMDSDMTSRILVKNDMPGLDVNLDRDDAIIDALEERPKSKQGTPLSVTEINEVLSGRNLPELVIVERKNKQLPKKTASLPYRIVRDYVQTFDESDRYDSFATAYAFQYFCHATVVLDCGASRMIRMTLLQDGSCRIEDSNAPEPGLPVLIYSESEAGELAPYYVRLKDSVRKKLRELDAILFDSKNYRGRISARLTNDLIHVFFEEYNYSSPAANEYFLMEYVDGHYQLTIAHRSMFMQRYLSDAEYCKHYGAPDDNTVCSYSSEEEIVDRLDKASTYHQKDRLKRRLSVYRRLQKKVSECLDQLRNREIFIQNIDAIWSNPADVLSYYKVEEAYGVVRDPEYNEIIHANSTAELTGEDGLPVPVSFEDITRAFELGFDDISQICRVIKAQGSIESVLK